MRVLRSRTAAVVAGTLVVVGLGAGTATAGRLIGSNDIAKNAVASKHIKNGTIKPADLSKGLKAKIDRAGKPGKDGAAGKDGSDAAITAVAADGTATVVDIGGTFGKFTETVRATKVATLDLQPGKYHLTGEGFFVSNAATSGQTRMQLALRVKDGSEWGKDLGTCFTGAISPLANREASCSSTRVVTLTSAATVEAYAFGYADDQGSADSGKVKATAYVTALAVN